MIYNKENWEEMYKTKFTPWDAKNPDPNLVRVVDGGCIKPCKTIDLGCGTGNESLFLSSKGFTVTGIDISEIAIKESQEKAKKEGVTCEFIQSDILTLELDQKYDLALDRRCLHFLDNQEQITYVRKLSEILNSGCKFLLIVSSEYEKDGDLKRHHFSIKDIYNLFERNFIFLSIELITLETHTEKPKSYLCLMERK